MNKFQVIFLSLLFVITGLFSCNRNESSDHQTEYKKPNIILIYSDDVGYGDISSYGAKSIETPNIDRLAKQGVRFTNAHTSSATCTPSRYSLLTGKYAWRKKGTGIARGNAPLIIDSSRINLPDIMKRAGYKTGAVGKWHLGLGPSPEGPDWNGEIAPGPLELGFDYCYLIPATPDRVPTVYLENHHIDNLDPDDSIRVSYEHKIGDLPTGKNHPELLKMKASHGHNQTIINGIGRIGYMSGGKSALWNDTTISTVMTRKAVNYIRENRNNPFFLYFASHDIHVPRVPAKQFAGKSGMGPRGDEILELDWEVGRIMETLDSLNIADNTMIIFSSDNGPVLDDGYRDRAVQGAKHPKLTPNNRDLVPPHEANQPAPSLPPHKPAGPLRGGKYSIFEGGTRVPFIVRWPGQIKKGITSDALISQVDLLASLAELTNQSIEKDAGPDSFDMLTVLLGKSKEGRDYLVEQARTLALIHNNWKYIQPNNGAKINRNTHTELGNNSKPQLYNLDMDLGEMRNVADRYPDIVKQMADTLEKIIQRGRSR